jgi:hypothetical protein
MNNLYWQMYKNLERELLNASDNIHFDDRQLNVYSVKIADLLTRSVIEIEAISKDLFKQAGGETPKDEDGKKMNLRFDADCIQLLDKEWRISKRQVVVSALNFYFEKDENRSFTPLKDANKIGQRDWKKAYQAVKHNRVADLEKGNIKHLIRAMAALYILNLYYKNLRFELGTSLILSDLSFGSDVFSVTAAVVRQQFYTKEVVLPTDTQNAMYLIKPHEAAYAKYQKEAKTAFSRQIKYIESKKPELKPKSRTEVFDHAQALNVVKEIAEFDKRANAMFEQLTYEAILNRNQLIYKEEK